MRIAVLTHDDRTWALPAWAETIPLLRREHDLVGVVVVPYRLGRSRGIAARLRHLRTFGAWPSLLLGLFAARRAWERRRGPTPTWEALAAHHGLVLRRAGGPNEPDVARWIADRRTDVLLAMTGEILRRPILEAPAVGVVAKHASLLPSCRGLFPFLWARLDGVPTGVTFFRVREEIDGGEILLQRAYPFAGEPSRGEDPSLLRFYIDVFAAFPGMAAEAVRRLASGTRDRPPPSVAPSYHGLPSRADVRSFLRLGGRIASLRDLLS